MSHRTGQHFDEATRLLGEADGRSLPSAASCAIQAQTHALLAVADELARINETLLLMPQAAPPDLKVATAAPSEHGLKGLPGFSGR